MSFDYGAIRPAGSRLKTMGGKSSGPAPLQSLLEFTRERIFRRQGRHLSNLDAHDIICKIGEWRQPKGGWKIPFDEKLD